MCGSFYSICTIPNKNIGGRVRKDKGPCDSGQRQETQMAGKNHVDRVWHIWKHCQPNPWRNSLGRQNIFHTWCWTASKSIWIDMNFKPPPQTMHTHQFTVPFKMWGWKPWGRKEYVFAALNILLQKSWRSDKYIKMPPTASALGTSKIKPKGDVMRCTL